MCSMEHNHHSITCAMKLNNCFQVILFTILEILYMLRTKIPLWNEQHMGLEKHEVFLELMD